MTTEYNKVYKWRCCFERRVENPCSKSVQET